MLVGKIWVGGRIRDGAKIMAQLWQSQIEVEQNYRISLITSHRYY